ncbi:hypothetical protein AAL_03852 [Moelleriella libera RCEF 2490]|uniref:Uncharacterized protein n=1 Tax=Moelleriella libera RCEF 2490 TaxID=1081109 RepID=A0A162IQ03_9HYPO|nr:hypothetical protein AAL_03852 [Moelleriella libera RCEF 2490]
MGREVEMEEARADVSEIIQIPKEWSPERSRRRSQGHREFSLNVFVGLLPAHWEYDAPPAVYPRQESEEYKKAVSDHLASMVQQSALTQQQAEKFQSYVNIGVWTGPPPWLKEPASWELLLSNMHAWTKPSSVPRSHDRPRRRQEHYLKQSFLDDNIMQGPPGYTKANLKTPRLRRCPFNVSSIDWNRSVPLAWGFDGFVWKVWFKEDGPYALKMTWDATLPADTDFGFGYWAFQRECQTAAILQMIQESVRQAVAEGSVILVGSNPRTRQDALSNLCQFSVGRHVKSLRPNLPGLTAVSSIPRIVQCYGWLEFDVRTMNHIPENNWPGCRLVDERKQFTRQIYDDTAYTGIVYEYIEDDYNDPVVVEEMVRLLWLAGFSRAGSTQAKHWRSSILVDHCSIVYPRGFGWTGSQYRVGSAQSIFGQ